jgi:sulfur carrier protein ThiS
MKLYAGSYLTFYMPERKSSLELSLEAPTPLTEILARIGLPLSELALAAINGELVDPETATVQDDDQVRIFSAVDGG